MRTWFAFLGRSWYERLVKREETRETVYRAVLQAAFNSVSKYGIAGIKMYKVAQAAELSVGGLYRHFEGKRDILVELEKEAINHYGAFLDARLAVAEEKIRGRRGQAAALARLIATGMAYLEHAVAEDARHYLLDLFISTPHVLFIDEEAVKVEAVLKPILARCATLFDAAVGARALSAGDSMTRTFVLWATVHGADHFRKRDRLVERHLHADLIARAALDAILGGWGASALRLREAHELLA
jgi:AcrR family transcriptional regulator